MSKHNKHSIMSFKRINDKKIVGLLVWSCTLIYFMSYMTRLNYAAVVAEISHDTGIANSLLAFPVTGLFITYGIGQLISGWLGDRIAPKWLMFAGLAISTCMNILLPLSTNVVYMTAVWCVNGFGQALMWPPMVKILSGYLSAQDYMKSTFTVIIGSTCGTIGVYLLAAGCSYLLSWQFMFFICAAFGIIGMVLCLFGITRVERYAKVYGEDVDGPVLLNGEKVQEHHAAVKINGGIAAMIVIIMLAIVCQGSLRDGVTTWMPTYINETFNMGSGSSILSGVILPIFTLLCVTVVKMIFPRFIRNELAFAGIIFSVGVLSAVVLSIFPTSTPIISIGCSALLVACMHGVNQMLICLVPGHFKKTGKISTISGLLNFATYVGAALSTYVFASLADGDNWRPVIILWVFIAAAGALICFGLIKTWWKFRKL